jgi:hypothetical protein
MVGSTYQTAEAVRMPLAPQRLNHHIRHRLPALATLRTVAISMTIATPRVPILLNKRRASVKRITTLRTEEVASVPFGTTRNDNLAFDRCLARFAAWAEHLVEVEGAVEAHRRLAVCFFGLVELVVCDVVRDVAGQASCNTL